MKIMILALLAAFAPAQEVENPPSIMYGSKRESKAWIKTPAGTSVAIDDGITWKGVTVYLSLTQDLVAVESKTGATLWAKNVGAFWNCITFVEISRAGGRSWAIELRPGPGEIEGKDKVQRHNMRTGEVLPSGEEKPAGVEIKPRKAWSGSVSRIAKGFTAVVSTQENWSTLGDRLFAGTGFSDMGKYHKPDFTKEIVVVISDGDSGNCDGIGVESAYRDDKRILVRLVHHTYQTDGEASRVRPFGIFVLPRKDGEAIHLEKNIQRYIGGPPIWKEVGKLERPKDPAKELEGVPDSEPMKLPAQEKTILAWNPPGKRVLSAKVKTTMSLEDKDRQVTGSFECDSELHPSEETSKEGRVFALKVIRLHTIHRKKEAESEVLFERGKEIVLKGDAALESGAFKNMDGNHETVITSLGVRQADLANDHIAQTMSLGLVPVQLSADPVAAGSTWESDVQVRFQGPDFIGKLKYKVDQINKGKTATIGIRAVERDSEDRFTWVGSGTLLYSFEDSLIRNLKFTLRRRDKEGRVLAELEQDLSVTLKP